MRLMASAPQISPAPSHVRDSTSQFSRQHRFNPDASTAICWQRLPTELQLHVVACLDPPSVAALGQVDRASRGLVQAFGQFAFQQRLLMAEAWHKSGQALLDVLSGHKQVFRKREAPWIFFQPDAALLAGIALLTQGSHQRPVALFPQGRPPLTWPAVPAGIDAFDEFTYLRQTFVTFDANMSRIGFNWPYRGHCHPTIRDVMDQHLYFTRMRQLMGFINVPRMDPGFASARDALKWVHAMFRKTEHGPPLDFDTRSALNITSIIRDCLRPGTTLCRGLPDLMPPRSIGSWVVLTTLQALSASPSEAVTWMTTQELQAWRLDVVREFKRRLAHAPDSVARATNDLDEYIKFERG